MNSKVEIHTGVREGVTFLKDSFFTPPYKIANITACQAEKCLDLMLMSSSPGILDGDESYFEIGLCEDSSLNLHTQSYQRLFPMTAGAAQRITVQMEKKSSLIYLPHPVVPHEKSIFSAMNKIYLDVGCQLTWGEIITCGRKSCDEIFRLHAYQNITELYYQDKLIVKENLLLKPSLKKPDAMGQLEQFTHQASLIYWNENKSVEARIPDLLDRLGSEKDMESGATTFSRGGMMIRMLGYHAEQLHHCMKSIAEWLEKDPVSVPINNLIQEYAD
jgi:urease accessory protein